MWSSLKLPQIAACLGSRATSTRRLASTAAARAVRHSPSAAALLARTMGGGLAASLAVYAAVNTTDTARCVEIHKLKKSMFGNYENRIRRHANPEKVFEYFASVTGDDGEVYMTPEDFVRAVTPYNPYIDTEVGSRNRKFDSSRKQSKPPTPQALAEYTQLLAAALEDDNVTKDELAGLKKARDRLGIDGTSHLRCVHDLGVSVKEFDALVEEKGGAPQSPFYRLIDSNGDGLIDYGEYVFFVTVLSVPLEQFAIAFRLFDVNGDGGIDRHEFAKLMQLMRHQSNQGRHVREGSSLVDPDDRVKHGGSFPAFFGKAGDKSLTLQEFSTFVTALKAAIHEHEFRCWDRDNNGSLSAEEFGMSLVSYATGDHSKYIERAKKLKDVRGRVTKEEFMAFQQFLSHLDAMEVALGMATARNDGAVDADAFRRAAAAAIKAPLLTSKVSSTTTGHHEAPPTLLSPLQVEILFIMFDDNGDGKLATEECVEVLRSRSTRDLDRRRDLGVVDMMGKLARCMMVTWSN